MLKLHKDVGCGRLRWKSRRRCSLLEPPFENLLHICHDDPPTARECERDICAGPCRSLCFIGKNIERDISFDIHLTQSM